MTKKKMYLLRPRINKQIQVKVQREIAPHLAQVKDHLTINLPPRRVKALHRTPKKMKAALKAPRIALLAKEVKVRKKVAVRVNPVVLVQVKAKEKIVKAVVVNHQVPPQVPRMILRCMEGM